MFDNTDPLCGELTVDSQQTGPVKQNFDSIFVVNLDRILSNPEWAMKWDVLINTQVASNLWVMTEIIRRPDEVWDAF